LHQELAAEQPLEIVSTFLGAHVVPAEFRGKADGAGKIYRAATERTDAGSGEPKAGEFCDVFCDRGAFTRAQSKRILEAGKE